VAVPSWSRIATRLRVPLGFVFAAAYLWFAWPRWMWVAAGSVFVVAGLVVRAAASGHIRKNRELTATGPYAYTRNPLYLGSILIAAGFVVAARNPWIAMASLLMFVIIYLPVIRAEESYLRSAFADYPQYAAQVPRLFPRLAPYRPAANKQRGGSESGVPGASGVGAQGWESARYSRALYLRHREYNAALGSGLMMVALILKMMWGRS
jgi:protein-S-isoprenylcysteine O-methyltransferase Ste14